MGAWKGLKFQAHLSSVFLRLEEDPGHMLNLAGFGLFIVVFFFFLVQVAFDMLEKLDTKRKF